MKNNTTTTKHAKTLKGVVVSDKMEKTVVVSVDRYVKNPKYQKYQKISKKYKVHDETNSKKVGDVVVIAPSRPLSKDKHFVKDGDAVVRIYVAENPQTPPAILAQL